MMSPIRPCWTSERFARAEDSALALASFASFASLAALSPSLLEGMRFCSGRSQFSELWVLQLVASGSVHRDRITNSEPDSLMLEFSPKMYWVLFMGAIIKTR